MEISRQHQNTAPNSKRQFVFSLVHSLPFVNYKASCRILRAVARINRASVITEFVHSVTQLTTWFPSWLAFSRFRDTVVLLLAASDGAVTTEHCSANNLPIFLSITQSDLRPLHANKNNQSPAKSAGWDALKSSAPLL